MESNKKIELYPRSLVKVIKEALADTPVVCLLGLRQSGKTTLAQAEWTDQDLRFSASFGNSEKRKNPAVLPATGGTTQETKCLSIVLSALRHLQGIL